MSGTFKNKLFLSRCAQDNNRVGPHAFFRNFQQDESGVTTIDFAILAALTVVFGLGISQATLNGTRAFATDVVAALGATQPINNGGNGGGDGGNGSGGDSGDGGSGSGGGILGYGLLCVDDIYTALCFPSTTP